MLSDDRPRRCQAVTDELKICRRRSRYVTDNGKHYCTQHARIWAKANRAVFIRSRAALAATPPPQPDSTGTE